MSEERDVVVKALGILASHLEIMAAEIREVLKELAPETAIPELDPEELMRHEWKGRKTGEGQYAKGSVSWGWDWRDEFSPSVIKTLEKGPLQIDQYEFTLGDRIVQAKKVKRSNPHAKMERSIKSIHSAAKRMGLKR